MSSFLNRLKNLKTEINNSLGDGDTRSISSFDEEGFLCPICHRKFPDTMGLEHHYIQAHSQPTSTSMYENTNGNKNSPRHEQIDDPYQEVSVWKQQFVTSEESRMQLSSELMKQRQRVSDLEEEVELLQKQFRSTQKKVVTQSQEIGNLKANKDIYDAQLAIFSNELLNTQGELKEKQNQVDTLCNDLIPRPTNDDVDVLKRELITVQQRMNDMSLEKEQQIEQLREVISEISNYTKRLDQIENTFDQNLITYEEILNTPNDLNQIKQFIDLTRKIIQPYKNLRIQFNENEEEINQFKQTNNQLQNDLEQRNQSNEQLTKDLENEQQQNNSYRTQIETLTKEYENEQKQNTSYKNQIETLNNDIQEFEKQFEDLKQEKNQLVFEKMEGDQDDQRQNLVKQLTQEKDQFEQQIKELRKQLTQINNEKNQLHEEHIQLNNDNTSLKQKLDDLNNDKEQQTTALNLELSSIREQHTNINNKLENDLREANEKHDNQNQEIERLKTQFETEKHELNQTLNQKEELINQTLNQKEELINQTKSQIDSIEKEKDDLNQQIVNNQQTIDESQTTISQLNTELDHKNNSINRLSDSIRRSINLAHKTHDYIQQNIHTSQMNLLEIIEQSEQESQTIRSQTKEDIRNEFTNYLTVIHTVLIENNNKLEKQLEEDSLKLAEVKQHAKDELNQIQTEYKQLIKEYEEKAQNLESQLDEMNKNFSQVSQSLSQTTQTANDQREKFEKQISSLEDELANTRSDYESRIKKYERQLAALTENLSTVRGELKTAQESLIDYGDIKTEKTDLARRLSTTQDERQTLLERSLTIESRNEKLLLENGQLAKKNSDLESALQEIAREYQSLQILTNKSSQRRWLNDSDVHECMKCNQTFTLTQRKHHCRCCGNIFCDQCSTKTAIIAATSKKPQRVCDQCYKELTS